LTGYLATHHEANTTRYSGSRTRKQQKFCRSGC
jgi:hypothetical protein